VDGVKIVFQKKRGVLVDPANAANGKKKFEFTSLVCLYLTYLSLCLEK